MKRQIWFEPYEIETIAGALEKHAGKEFLDGGYPLQVGRRELDRLARRLRALLAPKPAPRIK